MRREINASVRRGRVAAVLGGPHRRPNPFGVTISVVEGLCREHSDSAPRECGEVEMAKLEIVVVRIGAMVVISSNARRSPQGVATARFSSLAWSRQCRFDPAGGAR